MRETSCVDAHDATVIGGAGDVPPLAIVPNHHRAVVDVKPTYLAELELWHLLPAHLPCLQVQRVLHPAVYHHGITRWLGVASTEQTG